MPLEPRIKLVANYPRWELYRPGWGMLRPAATFQPVKWDPTAKSRAGSTTTGRWVPGTWPEDVWLEPETGTLLLTPHVLRPDAVESADWLTAQVPLTDMRFPIVGGLPAETFLETVDTALAANPRVWHLLRASETADLPGLEDSPRSIPDSLNDLNVGQWSLTWATMTKDPLKINEGWSVTIMPYGLPQDSAAALIGFWFGDVWYLQLTMNGWAALYERTSVHTGTANATWVLRERFEFATGGINMERAFRMTVIPWGTQFLSFLFSQSVPSTSKPRRADAPTHNVSNHLYRINRGRPSVAYCPYNPVTKQFTKTEPSHLGIALRRKRYQVSLSLCKVRYKTATIHIGPEALPSPRPEVTSITHTAIGYFGQRADGTGIGTSAASIYMRDTTNSSVTAWTNTTDTRFVSRIVLTPSSDARYTPELWALDVLFPTVTRIKDPGGEADYSEFWSSISWRESSRPDGSTMTVKINRSGDFRYWFKLDGAFKLEIDDEVLWEGQLEQYNPVFEGGVGKRRNPADSPDPGDPPEPDPAEGIVLVNTMTLQDAPTITDVLWERLNATSSSNLASPRNKSLGKFIEQACNLVGFPDSEISVSAELYQVPMDDWDNDAWRREPNDFKRGSDDASVGDVLREAFERYAQQARNEVRLARRRGLCVAYLTEEYNPDGDAPLVTFYLNEGALPTEIREMPLSERWERRYFKILTHLNPTIRRPRFNSLIGHAATVSGDPADLYSAYIDPHPRALTDPGYVDYVGSAREHVLHPSQTAGCASQNELERYVRRFYDRESVALRVVEFDAEWQPTRWPVSEGGDGHRALMVDRLCRIIGLCPYDVMSDESEVIMRAGQRCSFGAWRIHDIAATFDRDMVGQRGVEGWTDWTWGWSAGYSAEYVGVSEDEGAGLLMFTDIVPPYGLNRRLSR